MIGILQELQYYTCRLITGLYYFLSCAFLLSFIFTIGVGIWYVIKDKKNPLPTLYYDVCKSLLGRVRLVVGKILWVLFIITLFLLTNQDFLKQYNIGAVDEDGYYTSYIHYSYVFLIICLVTMILALISYYCGHRKDKNKQYDLKKKAIYGIDRKMDLIHYTYANINSLKTMLNNQKNDEPLFVYVRKITKDSLDDTLKNIIWEYKTEEEIIFEKEIGKNDSSEYEKVEVSVLLEKLNEQGRNAEKNLRENQKFLTDYIVYNRKML